jgi:hypothetical protein
VTGGAALGPNIWRIRCSSFDLQGSLLKEDGIEQDYNAEISNTRLGQYRAARLFIVLTLLLFLCWPQSRYVQAAGGDFDFTFGDGGRVITDISTADDIHALAVQPDGEIIAVGFGTGNFALARYNIDGTPDFTFGTGGKVDTRLRNTFSEGCVPRSPLR